MPLFKSLLRSSRSFFNRMRSADGAPISRGVRVEPLEDRRLYASHIKYVPKFSHVVVVMEENQAQSNIIGNSQLGYINSLANSGANFSNSFGVAHPSQPNYLALFSGSTQGAVDDSSVGPFSGHNLAEELATRHQTFAMYSEGLPFDGYTGGDTGAYVSKHNPSADFTNVPSSAQHTFADFPQTSAGFKSMPTVSFVVPTLQHDMHDGSPLAGNNWLKTNLGAYAKWATANNSLLIVTWDEDDNTSSNNIPTIFYGANVKTGVYSETINHYNVLRTVEDMYSLQHFGNTGSYGDIRDVWTSPPKVVKAVAVAAATRAIDVAAFSTAPQKQLGDLKSLLEV